MRQRTLQPHRKDVLDQAAQLETENSVFFFFPPPQRSVGCCCQFRDGVCVITLPSTLTALAIGEVTVTLKATMGLDACCSLVFMQMSVCACCASVGVRDADKDVEIGDSEEGLWQAN